MATAFGAKDKIVPCSLFRQKSSNSVQQMHPGHIIHGGTMVLKSVAKEEKSVMGMPHYLGIKMNYEIGNRPTRSRGIKRSDAFLFHGHSRKDEPSSFDNGPMSSKLVEETIFHGAKRNLNSRRTRRNYPHQYRRSIVSIETFTNNSRSS